MVPQPNLTLNPVNVSYARQFIGDSSTSSTSNLWNYAADLGTSEFFRESGGFATELDGATVSLLMNDPGTYTIDFVIRVTTAVLESTVQNVIAFLNGILSDGFADGVLTYAYDTGLADNSMRFAYANIGSSWIIRGGVLAVATALRRRFSLAISGSHTAIVRNTL